MSNKRSAILIASAGSLDGILKAINRYYYSSNARLEHVPDTAIWQVYTGKGLCSGTRVRQVGKRFRFESISEANK